MRCVSFHCRSRILLVLMCLSLIGCDSNPTGPTDGASLTLAPGQIAAVPGTQLTLHFIAVTSDSRCPATAICIQLGEAVAALDGSLPSQDASRVELRTSDAGRVAQIGSYRIELVTLQPYPLGSEPINPAEYRLTLRVDGP